MKFLDNKVERPGLALLVYFGIGAILYANGITDGSLIVFDILAGLFIYKGLSRY